MPAIVDPANGLEFYELSHPWGYFTPIQPGYDDVKFERIVHHAKYGAMTHKITTIMHQSTHVNAPVHLTPGGTAIGNVPLDRFFGNGVVLSIPKPKWGTISAKDIEAATPKIEDGDIVVIATGWHRRYSDSRAYFGHAPGLTEDAAEWLIGRRIRLLGMDTPSIDHPLATSLAPHRNGPIIKDLAKEYDAATGRSAAKDFPKWLPAHRALLRAGIPTIENVGGDVAEIVGKRSTFHACPWRWTEGDACIVRFVALRDPAGAYRLSEAKQ